jgi:autotransporter-associated beta strand protein
MITRIIPTVHLVAVFTIAVVLGSGRSLDAQTANWTGTAGDGDWNNTLNWDIGVPAEGTNAAIGVGIVANYNSPMVAGSFGGVAPGLSLSTAILNVNASGFVIGASGTGAATVSGSGSRLNVNAGGIMSITNGGLTLGSVAAATLAVGGSIDMSGPLQVGSSTGTATMTNSGGNLSATSTAINPNNSSASPSCILTISGGSNFLGNVSIRRANPSSQPAPGTEGLVVSNGVVNMSSLALNTGNSFATMFVTGGAVTNTGTFIVGQQNAANGRATRFLQTGGLVVSSPAEGVRLGVSNSTQTVNYIVQGGTNVVERFFIGDGTNGATGISVNLTNAANIYIGSGGIVSNLQGNIVIALNNGGLFGASANWSSSAAMVLNNGSGTFNAADLAGASHNISLSGVIRGPGGLTKAGSGTLTLSATNTYNGATTANQGVLALTSTGSISNSTQLSVNGPGILDLSAVAAPTLLSGQTLSGDGAVVGNLTALTGSTIRPGGVSTAGTLTLSNSLTELGSFGPPGVTLSFDLSDDPTGTIHANDFLVINGDLNLSGTNNIQINPLNGPLTGGNVYKLIQYAGNFNGGISNFNVPGILSGLSNNPANKTIYAIVQGTRSPTSVVWLGGLGGNAWDTSGVSNWLNGASRDIFVSGDIVRFDSTGATNALVNLIGSVGPSSTTVDTASNYTFIGSGSMDGPGGIIKTNSGTLSLLTTNGYLGSTVIGQGTLEVIRLANGGSASSIGSANSDPTNLVSYGTVLRYLGPSAGTDHGMTLNDTGVTVDVTNSASRLAASGVLAGPGALTKTGPGTLALAGANSYAGGTIISNGVLELNNTGVVTNTGVTNFNATLRIATGTTSTLTNVLDFNGTCTVDLNNTAGDTHLTGAWSGSGTINIINQQTNSRTFTVGGNGAGGGNLLNFFGTIAMSTNVGFLRFNDGGGNPNLGTTNVTIDLGSSNATFLVRNGGVTVDLGAVTGGPGTRLTGRGSGSSGTVVYSVGSKNLSTTFAGTITNGNNATAITKVGTGTWTLSGTNSFGGVTVVSNGVLALSGSGSLTVTPSITVVSNAFLDVSARSDGALPLNSGQTLSGDGAIRGSVIASSGSTIDPGSAPGVISTFTITNVLQLQSGSTINMDLDYYQFLGSGTNDFITGLASVTYGGTLTLVIDSIETNSVFKLFSANSYSGAFDAIIPPLPPFTGLAWDTSRLTVDGTLGLTKLRPTISNVAISGTDFVISAINGPPGGNVLVLTSANIAAPLNTWTTLVTTQFDGGGNLSISDPINTGSAQRFYTLQLQ